MTDTHAHIASKGCDATGITEDIAAELFQQVGRSIMAIVEIQVADKSGPNLKGKRKVHMVLEQIEPAMDPSLDEHLRELTRTLFYNRKVDEGQPTLDGDDVEPKVADVLAAGARYRPHPYMTSQLAIDDSEAGPVCDVCGRIEDAAVHQAEQSDDDPDEPDEEEPDDEPDDERDTEDEDEEQPNSGISDPFTVPEDGPDTDPDAEAPTSRHLTPVD